MKINDSKDSLKSSESDDLCNGGLWTVSLKSEKCVTLHSDFVKMPQGSHNKITFLTLFVLGDV